ncbi:MAG: TauD/TfdA family dioxygenase [Alphaproteobacteria bacterium]|nr:TauD/TfdA family dioxygenase [Alphaproteobacteria bacterium]
MTENPWTPSARAREPAVLGRPIVESGCWYPEDMAGATPWLYRLDRREADDIMAAVSRIEDEGRDIKDIRPADFPLPVLAPALADIRAELMDGRGFAIIRGLPTEELTIYQQAAAFWGVSTHIGRPFSQNAQGHLLGHVTNINPVIDDGTGRGYRSNDGLNFHADGCDVTALFCVQPAKSGGLHRICSSVALYNEMLRRRPELAEALAFYFYRSRRGELPEGQTEMWFRQPVFSVCDGYFAARGASNTILRAQGVPGVPDLTDVQREAIAYFQELAPELAIDIAFEPGDFEYAQSHVTLHARTAFEDWPEPERRRHLFRLWMSADGARPLVPEIAEEIERGITVEGVEPSAPLVPV